MQSTTAAGHRKDNKGRGDSATSNSVYIGTGVGASTAVNDNTQPKAYASGDPSSSNDGDSPDILAMQNEIMGRFVPRGPSNVPVKGAPLKPTGSRRDQHNQPPPGSSARSSNKPPPKGHTPATTATQPTTAGSGKRRPS